ncbi:MAG: hypothetical protein AABW80_01110 [Nanoarchaeota archaeon]
MSLAKTFLAIGIAVLLTVFFSYGLYVVYEKPSYGYVDSSECYAQYGCENMVNKCYTNVSTSDLGAPEKPREPSYNQSCYNQVYASSEYQKCQEDQQKCVESKEITSDNYKHSRNSFYILIVIAILSIIAGSFFWNMEGIGSGIMGGGVLIVLWSLAYTTDYWTTLNKYFKLIAVGIVLILLIYLGYKKLEQKLR